jgi:glutathionyl-hydroquinone reductase
MGRLVDGVWDANPKDPRKTGGRFVRAESAFRNWVGADASSAFPAAAGRYRLIVSHACPWAHRTVIFRTLKGLDDAIPLTVVDPLMGENGWILPDGNPVHTVYTAAMADYSGRVTVPILWDTKTETIVNNESSEIIRMFNDAFAGVGAPGRDFYPEALRPEIDSVNERIYQTVNNGVYRCGFSTAQDAYEEAVTALFETLDWLEERLTGQRFLVGNTLTEADWRLFTTLVRFDAVYVGHFKCNIRRLIDYPALWNYTRDLYQYPGVADTVHMDHIKGHYYRSHLNINPTAIVPAGPVLDFTAPHGREALGRDAA